MSDGPYIEYETRRVPVQNRLLAQAGHTEWKRVPVWKFPPGYRGRYERDFGAIAYSFGDRCWGWSTYYFTREQAEEQAIQACKGANPVIVAWGDRCWLALAEGKKIGAGRSLKKRTAGAIAMQEAGKHNGLRAQLITVFYTGTS